MAQFSEEVVLKLKDEFSGPIKGVEKSISGLKSAFGVLASGAGILGVSFGVKKMIDEFVESEKQSIQLSAALKSIGITSQSVKDDYEAFAKMIQSTTMFTDEQVISVERLMTQYGFVGDKMKVAVKASTDLAAAFNMDLNSAAMMLIKSTEGNSTAFKKLGIEIDETKYRLDPLGATIEAIEKKFPDFARAANDTFGGALNQMKKNADDLMESLGGMIAAFDKKHGVTKFWSDMFKQVREGMESDNDPISQMSNKVVELNKQLEKMNVIKAMAGTGWKFGDEQQLQALDKELKQATQDLKQLWDTKEANEKKGADQLKKFIPPPKEIKDDLDKVQAKFDQFWMQIDIDAAEGFEKIELERKKDLARYEAYLKESRNRLKNTEEFKRAEAQKTQRKLAEESTKTMTDISAIMVSFSERSAEGMKKAFEGLAAQVGRVAGNGGFGIAGQIFSAMMSMGTAIQNVVAAFDEDARTTFVRLSDEINKFASEIQEIEDRMAAIRGEEQRKGAGRSGVLGGIGDVDYGRARSEIERYSPGYVLNGNNPFLFQLRDIMSRGGFKFELDHVGDLSIGVSTGMVFAAMRGDTGEWSVKSRIYGLDEAGTLAVAKWVYNKFIESGQLKTSEIGAAENLTPYKGRDNSNASRSGNTRSFSSVSSLRSGSLTRMSAVRSPLSAGSTSNVVNVTVNTMDEQGVNEFVKNKLAPTLRYMTGRQGLVVMNSRGVSDNI